MFLLIALSRRLLVLAIVLAIPVIAVELLARKLVGDAVASAVKARIGVAPSIGFGSKPLLLQMAHGRLDRVTVRASGARIGGLPPLGLTATLNDVHLTHITSLQGAIGSLSVQARLGPVDVRDLIATSACVRSLPAAVAAALTTHPRVDILPGRIDVLPPSGRAVEVRLRPAAVATQVSFVLIGAQRDGVPIASAALASAAVLAGCARSLPNLPFGISLRSATAAQGALWLAFAGRGVSFSAIG